MGPRVSFLIAVRDWNPPFFSASVIIFFFKPPRISFPFLRVDTMEPSLPPLLPPIRAHCVWDRMKHSSSTDYTRGCTADRYFKVRVVHNSLLAWITRPARSCILREQWAPSNRRIHERARDGRLLRDPEKHLMELDFILNGVRVQSWIIESLIIKRSSAGLNCSNETMNF